MVNSEDSEKGTLSIISLNWSRTSRQILSVRQTCSPQIWYLSKSTKITTNTETAIPSTVLSLGGQCHHQMVGVVMVEIEVSPLRKLLALKHGGNFS